MGGMRIGGFDLVFSINEITLNQLVAASPLIPTGIQSEQTLAIFNGVIVTGVPVLGSWSLDLDDPEPDRVKLTNSFTFMAITIGGISIPTPAIGGSFSTSAKIRVSPPFGTPIPATGKGVVLDFSMASAIVALDESSTALLTSNGLDVGTIQEVLAAQLLSAIGMGTIPIFPAIMPGTTMPGTGLTILDIDVAKILSPTIGVNDSDELVIAAIALPGSVGTISSITGPLVPMGGSAVLVISNIALLNAILAPILASALGISPMSFTLATATAPLALAAPVGVGGATLPFPVTLTFLSATVVGGSIVLTGAIVMGGDGWRATSTFTTAISFTCTGATLTPTFTAPVVNTQIEFEWWVHVIGFLLGPLKSIVPNVILEVVGNLAGGAITRALGAFLIGRSGTLSVPMMMPFLATGSLSGCLLDDLVLSLDVVPPRVHGFAEGEVVIATNQGFDLDTGSTELILPGTTATSGIDVIWHGGGSSTSLRATDSVLMTPVSTRFEGLSLPDIQRLTLMHSNMPAHYFPVATPVGSIQNELVFAVRTSEGRFAKCGAHQTVEGNLILRYFVYRTQTPLLSLDIQWDVGQTEVIERGYYESVIYHETKLPALELNSPIQPDWTNSLPQLRPSLGDDNTWTWSYDPRSIGEGMGAIAHYPPQIDPRFIRGRPGTRPHISQPVDISSRSNEKSILVPERVTYEYEIQRVAWIGTFVAVTENMTHPIRFEWRINGRLLEQPSGNAVVGDHVLSYQIVDSSRLIIRSGFNKDLRNCEVCVHVVDAWNTERSRCQGVTQEATREVIEGNHLPLGTKVVVWKRMEE